MALFSSSFFSLAGQKERLTNAWETIKSAVTGGGVVAHTPSTTVNKVLETAANHPFITAAPVAIVANPTGALAAATAVKTSLASSFASSSLTTKAAVVGGGIIGSNVLLSSPKAASSVIQAPSSLANFGQNVGKFIENPSAGQALATIKENPIISAGILTATGVAIGGAVATTTNVLNTMAVRENTQATKAQSQMPADIQKNIADLTKAQNAAVYDWNSAVASTQAKAGDLQGMAMVPATMAGVAPVSASGASPTAPKKAKKATTKKKKAKPKPKKKAKKKAKRKAPAKKKKAKPRPKKRKTYKKKKAKRSK